MIDDNDLLFRIRISKIVFIPYGKLPVSAVCSMKFLEQHVKIKKKFSVFILRNSYLFNYLIQKKIFYYFKLF